MMWGKQAIREADARKFLSAAYILMGDKNF